MCVVANFKVEVGSMNVPHRDLYLSVTGSQCFQLGLLNLRISFIPPFTCRLTPALLCRTVVNGTAWVSGVSDWADWAAG